MNVFLSVIGRKLRHAGFVATILAMPLLGLPGQNNSKPLSLQQELALGADSFDLSLIGTVVEGPDGVLAISQGQDGTVRFFTASGRPLFTVGKKGEGPGEVTTVSRIGWLGADFWMADGISGRLLVFDSTGKFREQRKISGGVFGRPTGPASPYSQFRFQRILDNGNYLYKAVIRSPGTGNAPSSFTDWMITTRPDGTVIGPVTRLPEDRCGIRLPNASMNIPFCAQPLWEASLTGSHVIMAESLDQDQGLFRVTSVDVRSARPLFTREYRGTKHPISKKALEEYQAALPPALQKALASGGAQRTPKFYPVFLGLVAGNDGSFLIRTFRPGEKAGVEWRMFDAKGNEVGTIVLARETRPVNLSRSRLWCVEVDTDGMETLVRYRIGG